MGLSETPEVELIPHAIWIAPPEYVILRKLEYFRGGGSGKHLEDIRKMLPQVDALLDHDFLSRMIDKRGLAAHWAQI